MSFAGAKLTNIELMGKDADAHDAYSRTLEQQQRRKLDL